MIALIAFIAAGGALTIACCSLAYVVRAGRQTRASLAEATRLTAKASRLTAEAAQIQASNAARARRNRA
jgi:hypothetical protein